MKSLNLDTFDKFMIVKGAILTCVNSFAGLWNIKNGIVRYRFRRGGGNRPTLMYVMRRLYLLEIRIKVCGPE